MQKINIYNIYTYYQNKVKLNRHNYFISSTSFHFSDFLLFPLYFLLFSLPSSPYCTSTTIFSGTITFDTMTMRIFFGFKRSAYCFKQCTVLRELIFRLLCSLFRSFLTHRFFKCSTVMSSPRKQGRDEGSADYPNLNVNQRQRILTIWRFQLHSHQTDQRKKQSQHWTIPYDAYQKNLKNPLKTMPEMLLIVQFNCFIT